MGKKINLDIKNKQLAEALNLGGLREKLAKRTSGEKEPEAEVEKDDAVTVLNRADWLFVRIDDGAGLDELVGDTGFVGFPNELDGGPGPVARSHHRVVRLLGALPPVVAVHAVITAAHGGHPAGSRLCHDLLEPAEKPRTAVR